MKTLVVTADDFGLSLPVNEAVERAHRNGILTAASLMTGAPRWQDAVARARSMPSLGVGLHVTLINGRPVLPPAQIPNLVGPDDRFFNDPAKFGSALYFSSTARRQAQAEIAAQFERFRQTGLPMDHVNGHQHFHMHPVVSAAIAQLLPAFASPPVRIPVEPPLFRAIADRRLFRLCTRAFYGVMTRQLRARVMAAGSSVNDVVFGLNDSGAMVEARVTTFLEQLRPGVTELYFHPATARWSGSDNLPADYHPEAEFAALVSPRLRTKVEAIGARLTSFRAAFEA